MLFRIGGTSFSQNDGNSRRLIESSVLCVSEREHLKWNLLSLNGTNKRSFTHERRHGRVICGVNQVINS